MVDETEEGQSILKVISASQKGMCGICLLSFSITRVGLLKKLCPVTNHCPGSQKPSSHYKSQPHWEAQQWQCLAAVSGLTPFPNYSSGMLQRVLIDLVTWQVGIQHPSLKLQCQVTAIPVGTVSSTFPHTVFNTHRKERGFGSRLQLLITRSEMKLVYHHQSSSTIMREDNRAG